MKWQVVRCQFLIFALAIAHSFAAEPKPIFNGLLVVDTVTLKSGHSLRGGIARRALDGTLTMVVSREWLAGTNPMQLRTVLAENIEGQKSAWTQTRLRILKALESPVDAPHLTFFLKQELERIELLLANKNPPEPDFLWMELRPETVAKVVRVATGRQKIAFMAWNEGLAHVESRDAGSLVKELADRGVTPDDPFPDLAERLAARPQSDEEWAARLAIVEYSLAKSLDFQGMGETLALVRQGQPVNPGDLIPQLIQQQLGSLLKGITDDVVPSVKPKPESEVFESAIRQVEREKMRGFRATRLEIGDGTTKVTVETRFVADLGSGKWRTIWLDREAGDGTRPRPQAEAKIASDPQLKSAINALKSTGLADAATLEKAIRVGAATMATQQSADAAFSEFVDRYTRRLDGPPLWATQVPEAAHGPNHAN